MSKQTLKRRIKAANQIGKVTKAMSNVAGRKLARVLPLVDNSAQYQASLEALIESLPSAVLDHQFVSNKQTLKPLIIILATDKGLVGPLNRELMAKVNAITDNPVSVILVGAKAEQFITGKNVSILHTVKDIGDIPHADTTGAIASLALSLFEQKVVDSVSVLYQQYQSSTVHLPTIKSILPIDPSTFKKQDHFSFDIDPRIMLEALVTQLTASVLYAAMMSAKASEHATRVMSMQAASTNATGMRDQLTQISFKENQRAITSEIADTSNARRAIQNSTFL